MPQLFPAAFFFESSRPLFKTAAGRHFPKSGPHIKSKGVGTIQGIFEPAGTYPNSQSLGVVGAVVRQNLGRKQGKNRHDQA